MKNKIIKRLAIGTGIFTGIVLIVLLFMIEFSPYGNHNGFDYKLVKVSVDIDAPPAEVFTYLGNSDNAEEWSSFVEHITHLNPDEKADGELGAKRRCFKNKDESGEVWDEEILVVEENERRQLSCYNFQNFYLSVDNLLTEQLYEELEDGTKTRLSFTLFYPSGKASFIDELKMYFAAYEIASIYEANLQNIKHYVEGGE